jgi:hypothetical protein
MRGEGAVKVHRDSTGSIRTCYWFIFATLLGSWLGK